MGNCLGIRSVKKVQFTIAAETACIRPPMGETPLYEHNDAKPSYCIGDKRISRGNWWIPQGFTCAQKVYCEYCYDHNCINHKIAVKMPHRANNCSCDCPRKHQHPAPIPKICRKCLQTPPQIPLDLARTYHNSCKCCSGLTDLLIDELCRPCAIDLGLCYRCGK